MVTQDVKDVIAETLPAVKENARLITDTFYPILFERYPETKSLFNQTHQVMGTQRQALANAVVAYAANLDRLEVLGDAVSLIVHKHASLNILPEHYPLVGECLLAAIAKVFGEVATEEVLGAWGAIYGQLADILITAEEDVYRNNEEKMGGWRGVREFTLVKKVAESDIITSFYLEPKDGGPVANFQAGQYVGVKLNISGQEVTRNYSLSNPPGESFYRLSIKRELGGLVSESLHDSLRVNDSIMLTAPAGDFVLGDSERPLVLLTGGVGITPAISMLEPALKSGRSVQFIHAAINGAAHAFKDYVYALAEQYGNLSVSYCYSEPNAGDVYDVEGFLSEDNLRALIPLPQQVDLYFLGPKPFMEICFRSAKALGIPAEQVRYEFFGPLQTLEGLEVVEA